MDGSGGGVTVNSFISLDECTAEATTHGFDPFTQYWVTRANGAATHFRPGKTPINLPAGEELKE